MTDQGPRRRAGRRFVVMGAFTIAGVLMLGGAKFVAEDVWLQGLLLNVGAASLLAVPLWWVGRQLERTEERIEGTVEAVRTDLQATQEQVASLVETAARVTEAEAERRQQRDDAVASIGLAPSQDGLHEVLGFATNERAISSAGIRVRAHPGFGYYLRFRRGYHLENIDVVLEQPDSAPVGETIVWRPGESATDFLLEVSEALTAASAHPGVSFNGGTHIFSALATAIETAREVKTRFNGIDDASDVIEVCGDQWSVCDWGVLGWHAESLTPYTIDAASIGGERWRQHMREKEWVDMNQLTYALRTSASLHARGLERVAGTPSGT